MAFLLSRPWLVLIVSFLSLSLATYLGSTLLRRAATLSEEAQPDFSVVLTTTLTLLGLIIGFTFSMAIGRYDQRKTLEEAEANAIGTEYVRTDLLEPATAAKVRGLLRQYLDARIRYYGLLDRASLRATDERTAQLQRELWVAVVPAAAASKSPLDALVLSGMNDVLNSQGYTQAAWWNRIPLEAWCLMAVIAVLCNVLLGYGTRTPQRHHGLRLVLPGLLSVAFFLIADIDAPRHGVIRVGAQNLTALAQSLPPP